MLTTYYKRTHRPTGKKFVVKVDVEHRQHLLEYCIAWTTEDFSYVPCNEKGETELRHSSYPDPTKLDKGRQIA